MDCCKTAAVVAVRLLCALQESAVTQRTLHRTFRAKVELYLVWFSAVLYTSNSVIDCLVLHFHELIKRFVKTTNQLDSVKMDRMKLRE